MNENRFVKIFKLSKQAFGQYKLQIIILIILGFASGLLEGIGVNMLIPLFSFFGDGEGSNDFITQMIEKFFGFFHIDFSLIYILIFVSVLFLLKAIVQIVFSYIRISIQTNYEKQTRDKLFRKTLGAKWSYLLKQKLGHLGTILMVDVNASAAMLEVIATTIMTLTTLLMYLLVAVNISLQITLISLAIGGALFLLLKPLIYRSRQVAHKRNNMNKEIARHVNENILGMKTVKSMIAENKIAEIGSKYFEQMKGFLIQAFIFRTIAISFIQPVSVIFVCAIFAVSYYTSSFNFASLLAIVYLVQRIFTYIQMLQSNFHTINATIPFLSSALAYERDIVNYGEEDIGNSNFGFKESLAFRNITFSYVEDQPVLKDVSFEVKKGEMVGLIGFSGAGKTTIVDLTLRLFESSSGEILLDKKSISEIDLKKWRKRVGYVSQDIFLINDTIANNIKFYDDSITRKDVENAAKMAYINKFIRGLKDGFETVVGERGVMLSAGQRQRVVIARVLARNPEILLLDEATSALDNESEVRIQKAIEKLRGRMTIMVIAHRLSTVMNCDKLFVLENGKIVEQGRPEELLKDKKSYFYKVYNIRK